MFQGKNKDITKKLLGGLKIFHNVLKSGREKWRFTSG